MVFAVYAAGVDRDRPLDQLRIGEVEPTPTPDDWVEVQVRAAGLNHHDLWALKGQALSADQVPMILGTDAAGIGPDGSEVIVHSVIGDPRAGNGDETLDPKRSMLSERYPGTLARTVRVPAGNCIPKPAVFNWQEAACLPTAFLTAYRMLTTKAQVQPGDTVLVQGEMMIYGPGLWHVQYADLDAEVSFITISFELIGSDLDQLFNRRIRLDSEALPCTSTGRPSRASSSASSGVSTGSLRAPL